jgi:DNA-3-methyladenine glycosylase I
VAAASVGAVESLQVRCDWANSAPEYIEYHDEEWGTPLRGDDALFERLCL